jgi:TRAP-type transport system periplasmic protein
VRVLDAPGVLDSASELDAARASVAGDLDALLEARDLVRLGWLDFGEGRVFSTGPVVSPSDLAGRHTWMHPGDAVVDALLHAAGGPSVVLRLDQVLSGLGSGSVDTVIASALAVTGLTWSSHLSHVGDRPLFHLGGMTVMRRSTYLALPAAARAALDSTSASAHSRLATTVRQSDERSYAALTASGGLTVDAMSASAWDATCRTARTALVGSTYGRALLGEVEAAAR